MSYKKLLLIKYLALLVFCQCKQTQNKHFNSEVPTTKINALKNQDSDTVIGKWHWQSEDKSQEFTLKIKKITNDSIYAQYCAVYNNGQKLDCNFEDINNVKGIKINNETFKLVFYSFFGSSRDKGEAELKLVDNQTLRWKIIKKPEADYYAPHDVLLKKIESPDNLIVSKERSSQDIKYNSLPFDFEKFYNTCYNNEEDCLRLYPNYDGIEQTKILAEFGINEIPTKSFFLPKLKKIQPIILAFNDSDVEGYELVTIKDNKIISQKTIGEMDGETIKDFTISKNYNIDLFERSSTNDSRIMTSRLQINDEGIIVEYK